jgi:hypothetical protein
MLVRNIFSAAFAILKKTGYQKADVDWFSSQLQGLFEEKTSA